MWDIFAWALRVILEYTGDKGPNTHWAHGENIEITVNI